MITPAQTKYDLLAILPDETVLPLRNGLTSLGWEEQPAELAVRLTATLQDAPTTRGYLHTLLPLGLKVVLRCDWGEGSTEVFRGTCYTWRYTYASSSTLQIVCYDDLRSLAQNQEEFLFPQGTRGVDVLQRLFAELKIPTGVLEGPTTPMPKIVHRGTLAELILQVLNEAFYVGDQEYVVRAVAGKVHVVAPGQNRPIYVMTGRHVESAEDEEDISDLVTEVHVLGEEADALPGQASEGDAPVRPRIDLIVRVEDPEVRRFGRFRALVKGQQNDSAEDLLTRAQAILDEKGAPRRTRTVVAPSLPFLRRGDVVQIDAGTLSGLQLITGVQHDAGSRKMTLTIDSSGTAKHRLKRVADKTKDRLPGWEEVA